jgi:hypothetical protein
MSCSMILTLATGLLSERRLSPADEQRERIWREFSEEKATRAEAELELHNGDPHGCGGAAVPVALSGTCLCLG